MTHFKIGLSQSPALNPDLEEGEGVRNSRVNLQGTLRLYLPRNCSGRSKRGRAHHERSRAPARPSWAREQSSRVPTGAHRLHGDRRTVADPGPAIEEPAGGCVPGVPVVAGHTARAVNSMRSHQADSERAQRANCNRSLCRFWSNRCQILVRVVKSHTMAFLPWPLRKECLS